MLSNHPQKGDRYLLGFWFIFVKGGVLVQINKPSYVTDAVEWQMQNLGGGHIENTS